MLAITADRNGVGRVVISQPSFLGHDNSYLLGALKAHPARLRGVPWIEPRTTTARATHPLAFAAKWCI